MDWIKVVRAYGLAIVVAAVSFATTVVLFQAEVGPTITSLFSTLRCLPLAGMGFALSHASWATYRLWQADRGEGLLRLGCGGPLSREKYGPCSPHRT